MELYYGDETIKLLISHTNSLLEALQDFEDEGFISRPFEQTEEEEVEEEKGDSINAQKKINEENVFYAGSRRRDN